MRLDGSGRALEFSSITTRALTIIMRTFLRLIAVFLLPSGLTMAQGPGPKVVAAWASGPMEVRVAFDRSVDPSVAASIIGSSVKFGEVGKPGGRVGGERGTLKVAASRLIDEGRTLVLVTDPHPRESKYELVLPEVKLPDQAGPGSRVEVSYDLGGVEVAWLEAGKTQPNWSGWWPHPDPAMTREVVIKSSEHDRLWPLLARPGRATMHTLVTLPTGPATLLVESNRPFEVTLGSESVRSDQTHHATVKAESTGEAVDLSLSLSLSLSLTQVSGAAEPPRLQWTAITATSPGGRPLPLPRSAFLLPWAPPNPPSTPLPETPISLLKGGDPAQGRAVFYGEAAKCSTCHMVRGQGGAIGPDLTNLAGRDRAWIYQNIVEPSASIHPDFVSYTVAMKDGTIAMGVVRADGANALKVGDIDAKQTVIARSEVEEIRPSASSIMPVGLLGAIGEERTRDLLAFLTASEPPPDHR